MSSIQFHFYATATDLAPLLSALEAERKLQYTSRLWSETNEPQTYLSYVDIPGFGRAKEPDYGSNACYLVALRGSPVHVEQVPQRAGGVRFSIGQALNPDTVTFHPGGMYGEDVILDGAIGTIWEGPASRNLYRFMQKPFRDRFTQVREFLIGPQAFALWKAGARLTGSASSPPEFDLKPDSPGAPKPSIDLIPPDR